jgi:hypothetical protein
MDPLTDILLAVEAAAERGAAKAYAGQSTKPLRSGKTLAERWELSDDTIDRLRRDGMPAVRIKGQWRYDESLCREWLTTRQRQRHQEASGVLPLSRPRKAVAR